VISFCIKDNTFSLALLIFGVCASRIGLWAFDLTITLFMQNYIPENVRGIVGSMQKSMNGFLELTTYLLGFIFSDPNDFYIIVLAGYCSVGLGLVTYFLGVFRRRHEFPIETGRMR
jgi:iron-regulated transporter 1